MQSKTLDILKAMQKNVNAVVASSVMLNGAIHALINSYNDNIKDSELSTRIKRFSSSAIMLGDAFGRFQEDCDELVTHLDKYREGDIDIA